MSCQFGTNSNHLLSSQELKPNIEKAIRDIKSVTKISKN